jgi:acyl phosphate:glycerol-3-phosphate acyltransferase
VLEPSRGRAPTMIDPSSALVSAFLDRPTAWAAVLVSYLLGSVPFGLLLARLKGVDLRRVGSGNIGAANVARTLGRPWGIATFGFDAFKGFLPVFLFAPLSVGHAAGFPPEPSIGWLQVLCGTAAVLGHCYPLYLGFKGGKAVATGCGAVIAINPAVFLCGGAVWLVTLFTTRYVGFASVLMGVTFPIAMWALMKGERWDLVFGASLLTLLILIRHRSNFHRMWTGTEPRAGEKATLSNPTRPHG